MNSSMPMLMSPPFLPCSGNFERLFLYEDFFPFRLESSLNFALMSCWILSLLRKSEILMKRRSIHPYRGPCRQDGAQRAPQRCSSGHSGAG